MPQPTAFLPITAGQSVTLPKESVYIRPNLFCHDCRAKIGEAIEETELFTEGHVLADLYHLKDIRIYPLVAGEEYDSCTVEIAQNKRSEGLTVTVTGHIS